MSPVEENIGVSPCVYTPGGLFGELLTSLIIVNKLGLKKAPMENQGPLAFTQNEVQTLITCLLTEYPFPSNSLTLPLKDNPELQEYVDDEGQT